MASMQRYKLELPNDLKLIGRSVDDLMERARAAGFSHERLRLNLRVGITEALANAMLYGCCGTGKRVSLHAEFSPEQIVIRVTDEGSGFDPDTLDDPTTPAHIRRPHGRGIFLIRQLMDEVEFNEDGNSITMVLFREAPRSYPR